MMHKISELRWSIRARSTAASVVVVALALGVGGAVLIAVLYTSSVSALDAAATARLRDISVALQQDSPSELDSVLLAVDQRVTTVQVVDAVGKVVRSSIGAPSTPIVVGAQSESSSRARSTSVPGDGDLRASTQSVNTPTGPVTVIVGVGADDVESTITRVAVLLIVGTPLVAAVAGGATYWLVGRSLQSVERVRRRVSEISAADLSERLPIPVRRDEISSLAETMNAMLSRIETGHLTQRRFVSDASHELRSPLATVSAAIELGIGDPATVDRILLETTLLPEVSRMQHLVEDLLMLARADEGGLPLRLEDVDLDDIAQTEIRLLRQQCSHHVTAHFTPTRLRGDEAKLTRVLRNLTVNAARHATSTVEVAVWHDGETAHLTVADDGPGIAKADRDRVFERFVRLEHHRSRAQGGSGLGLAIVSEIIAAHIGRVEIVDRTGGGTVFHITMPMDSSDDSRGSTSVSQIGFETSR